jgi:hypothetical protein
VRIWGAQCNVFAVKYPPPPATKDMFWDPTVGTSGALVVDTTLIQAQMPVIGQYISISQLGTPTLYATLDAAVTATRWTTLSARGSNYSPGDLLSFTGGGTSFTFSQQMAIIVDQVNSGGVIQQWHFLWGGLYSANHWPTAPLTVDTTHSYMKTPATAGGAQITPAWSGWSVLNQQPSFTPGSGYTVGQVVTLNASGTVNQNHYPKLVVETVNGSSGIASWDWLDFGAFSINSPPPTTLAESSHTGTPFSISPVQWTGGPLATTIATFGQDAMRPSDTDIFLTDPTTVFAPGATTTMIVQYFYYGDDDGAVINSALASGGSTAIRLPGRCGTTTEIDLPQDTTGNMLNPTLIGDNFTSTGLYAFGSGSPHRPGHPLLSRVLYKGLQNSNGGGVRNIFIDGLGLPEGYGYYGFYNDRILPSTQYVGLAPSSSLTALPPAGDVIEVDGGKYMRISNVYAENAIGAGNAIYQCGVDEEFPDPTYQVSPSAAVGNIIMSDSRFDSNYTFSGATNPDFALKLENTCHDSVYQNISAYDGTKADILEYKGNLFSKIHLSSDAANGPTAGTITWANFTYPKLAGVADYGVYALGNTSLSQTQCDIANMACVYIGIDAGSTKLNPAQVTDTQMNCGSLSNVSSSYYGVELAAGTVNTTVSGTQAAGSCNVPGPQLVHIDSPPLDPSISICNNSNANVVFCGPAFSGFAAGQAYTQPAPAFSTFPTIVGTLYAVPFETPIGGTITQMQIDATLVTATTSCELGIYASSAGAPGALILDAGPTTFSSAGVQTIPSLNVLLSPQALYFLAVGCNQVVTLEGSASNGNLSGVLSGLQTVSNPNTNVSGSWTFVSGMLPPTFPTPTYASGTTPNVYVLP